ncbi:hypothetical protein M758_N008200 [Ceratodon purpureus]|nr:hypothetical protein M758_N008200 [Ceratodon purpureus]
MEDRGFHFSDDDPQEQDVHIENCRLTYQRDGGRERGVVSFRVQMYFLLSDVQEHELLLKEMSVVRLCL